MLNFRVRMGSGVFIAVWPLAKEYCTPLAGLTEPGGFALSLPKYSPNMQIWSNLIQMNTVLLGSHECLWELYPDQGVDFEKNVPARPMRVPP